MLEKIRVLDVTGVYTIEHTSTRRTQMYARGSYGISLALSGEIVYHHGGKSFTSRSDNVIILPMGADYYYDCVRTGSFLLINFLPAEDFALDTFYSIKISDPQRYERLHRAVDQAWRTDGIGRDARMLASLYEIISMLCEGESESRAPLAVREAKKYIEANLSELTLSNSDVAGHLGISEVYLRKLFTKHTGLSPKQYIQSARINLAKQLLSSNSESIADVAEACGYSDVYTFSHAFRRVSGDTPKKYRERVKYL